MTRTLLPTSSADSAEGSALDVPTANALTPSAAGFSPAGGASPELRAHRMAELVIEAWEEAESESMRDGHAATLRDLIAGSIRPLLMALDGLVATVAELPENGTGTIQGQALNRAYSQALDVLERLMR